MTALYIWAVSHRRNLVWPQGHRCLNNVKNALCYFLLSPLPVLNEHYSWTSIVSQFDSVIQKGVCDKKKNTPDVCDAVEWSWPESRLQVPGVAHELPPVHCGVVDTIILVLVLVLVLVRGAFIMQGCGALLARPSRKHPRGKQGWGRVGGKKRKKEKKKKKKKRGNKVIAAPMFLTWQTHSSTTTSRSRTQ